MVPFFLGLFFLLSFANSYAITGVPATISYQGRLANASGDLLGGSGTTYYFKFSIWDNMTVGSGTRLWPTFAPTSVSATVRQGVFNVNIGDTSAGYPTALDYNFNTNTAIYLQVEVSSDDSTFQTLSPRARISASAFSQLSNAVSGTSTASSFGTTSPIGNSVVTIEASSTNAIGLSIRSAIAQVADLFRIQDNSGTNLITVNGAGRLGIATSTPANRFALGGNAYLDSNSITISSSTAANLTVSYQSRATTTILANTKYAFTIATGTSLTAPIFAIDSDNASSTFSGILNVASSTATSTFNGGVTTAGLASSQGLTILAGSLRNDSTGGIFGFNLSNCNGAGTDKLLWAASSGQFSCGSDATAGGGTINSGTTNRLTFYSGGTTLDSADFLGIYTSSAPAPRLGIGTSTPYAAFSVLSTSSPQFILTDSPNDASKITHWFASTTIGNLNFGIINNLNAGTTTYAIGHRKLLP